MRFIPPPAESTLIDRRYNSEKSQNIPPSLGFESTIPAFLAKSLIFLLYSTETVLISDRISSGKASQPQTGPILTFFHYRSPFSRINRNTGPACCLRQSGVFISLSIKHQQATVIRSLFSMIAKIM